LRRVIFSSADLPARLDDRARLASWLDVIRQTLGRRNIVRTADRPFSAWSELIQFGPVGLWRNKATITGTDRTPSDVAADGVDNFMLSLNVGTNRISFAQRGRETALDPGSWTILSLSEGLHIRGQSRWLNLVVPRRLLLELVATAEDLVVTPIDSRQAAVQHLQRYVGILLGPDGACDDPALTTHVGSTLLDLIAVALGAAREAAELARSRGVRAARLQEILAEIKARFADQAFSPGQVALKLGLSVRYVQNLIQQSGMSFTERVLELRLQKARTMLRDRRHDPLRVSAIAALCGFNQVSHFNRCFRRRFGAAPSTFRGRGEI
jgi:AraC-like DNA-binding protein